MADNTNKEPAMDMYLFIEGLKGNVTEPGHEGWIKINSLQFGMGVGIGNSRYRRRNQTPEEKEAEKKKKEEEEAAAKERGETEEEAWARRVRSSASVSSPSVSEITLTKETDISSPLFFYHGVLRKPARRAIIESIHRADKTVTRFELSTVFISGFSFSVGRNGRPSESVSLNFRDIVFGVKPAEGEATAVRYDLDEENTYVNGELAQPFFEKKKDDEDDY